MARSWISPAFLFALLIVGCSGGSSGPTPPARATATPTLSPAPGSGATATPTPASSPTLSPTPTATATHTPAPTPTATAIAPNACAQTPAPAVPSAVAVVAFDTFSSKLAAAHTICFSAYVFTNASFEALDQAARAGANETVLLPLEEQSDDQGDASQLTTDGAHVIYDPGSSTPPLHAKLAIVDGSAYLDGRNWDTSDIVINDTYAADFTAIENALAFAPSSSTNLDTLKSLALAREANSITSAAPMTGVTVRFMTESFSSGASNVIAALESAAQAGANVEVVVLSSYVQGNSSEESLLTTLKSAPYNMSVRLNPASGSEKMTLISSQATGWFGSANATSSSENDDNYIDWGLTVSDPSVLSSLQSYYDSVYASSTPY